MPTESGAANATSEAATLPIQPVITPGLGIAGVILMATGIALALVGIKHQWLHVFLSTALLTALAVTVLIVYVMNPPVPNAIQGAYVVAAVMTGLIFGSLALVFKEVAEGLGCLLGGFCLSMWFLTLAPGGLVSSTSGRAIMIAVFCLAFLGLYFSYYTRTYGLIFCTAFAGAQISIIGIDCFSRAGLKEFWMYIWNLNKNVFPLNTNTYPITRGIRVELACTIIICLFGVMSQFKIWKIVKEQREKKDAARLQAEEQRAQEESEVGRDIEASNGKELKQWEAVYGDKNASTLHIDSGVGSSIASGPRKQSTTISERQIDEIEMDPVPRSASKRTTVQSGVPAVVLEDASERADSPVLGLESVENLLSKHDGTVDDSEDGSRTPSARQSLEEPPAAQEGPANEEDDDDDDRASSVAAVDDAASRKHLSMPNSIYIRDHDHELTVPVPPLPRDRSPDPRRSVVELPVNEEDDEAIVRSPTSLDEHPLPTVTALKPQRRRSVEESSSSALPGRRLSDGGADDITVSGNLTDHLPGKLSKVAMTYRTNEWAKHIADADEPVAPETELGSQSPGIQVDTAFAEEAAKPVDVEALTPASPVMVRNTSQSSSKNPYRESIQATPKPLARTSSGAATPIYAFRSGSSMSLNRGSSGNTNQVMRSSSAMTLNRQNSSNSMSAKPRASVQGLRNVFAPLTSQPLIESPMEEDQLEDAADPGPSRVLHSAMSMASMSNLMGERQTRLKRKPTSTNFNVLAAQLTAGDSGNTDSLDARNETVYSPGSERQQFVAEEDMTLAERKAVIQQRETMQSPTFRDQSSSRQSARSLGTSSPIAPAETNHSTLIYDSHQPKRTNTVDKAHQANMLTQWRASIQQETAAKQPLVENHAARQAMLNQRQMAEFQLQNRQAERKRRESAVDVAMRTGQLHGAHRDALRRMQAKARESTQ
ncbi:hypothetical protein LTR78_003717 [Recurvomyces mirabilis]|uniref:TM7S3/TM198-like domain-containing protein n=1 Tax=Recurvomyces mirabilis TaxID=574656 RepID=A0AAE0WR81_9PEZI|nr:hypothetical protein LTR78_003717 [Recurvomyces mirabilis]KAK5154829.1 hypothetical protein LTS14_006410 [Recurvomyces mirabilis]